MAFEEVISRSQGFPGLDPSRIYPLWDNASSGDVGAAGKYFAGYGRRVAFYTATNNIGPVANIASIAGGVIPNDGIRRVWIYDRRTRAYVMASTKGGVLAAGHCGSEVSTDYTGLRVVFAYKLTGPTDPWFPGGIANQYMIVGIDLLSGEVKLLTTQWGTDPALQIPCNGNNRSPMISGDGTMVSWTSDAGNLIEFSLGGDPVCRPFDLSTPTFYIARALDGGKQNNILPTLGSPCFGYSGKVCYFNSDATNISKEVTTRDTVQIYRQNLATGKRHLLTKYPDTGLPFTGDNTANKVGNHFQVCDASADSVVFTCYCSPPIASSKVVAGVGTGAYATCIVMRWSTGEIIKPITNKDGVEGNLEQADPSISPDGLAVACEDASTNMHDASIGEEATIAGYLYINRRFLNESRAKNVHRRPDGSLPITHPWCHNTDGVAYQGLDPVGGSYSAAYSCPAHPNNPVTGLGLGGSPRLAVGGDVVYNISRKGYFEIMLANAA